MVEVRNILKQLLAASIALTLAACSHEKNVAISIERYRLDMMSEAVEKDRQTDSIISIYRNEVHQLMARPIGETDEYMEAQRPESNLTRLLSSAVMTEAQEMCKELGMPTPDVCILNTGGIRTTLPKGQVTVGNIFEISPFENSAVFMKASGSTLTAIMQHIAKRGGESICGAELLISKDGKLIEAKIGGKAIDADKTYTIVTSNYVAEGGDGFEVMRQCKRVDTGMMTRDILINYIEKLAAQGKHIIAPNDVRIRIEE